MKHLPYSNYSGYRCRKCRRYRHAEKLERRGRHYYCCIDAQDCAAAKEPTDAH